MSAEAALAASARCSTVTAQRTTMVAVPQAAMTAAKDSISFLGTDRFCSIFYARGEDYSLSLTARCSPKPYRLTPEIYVGEMGVSQSAFHTTDRAVSSR